MPAHRINRYKRIIKGLSTNIKKLKVMKTLFADNNIFEAFEILTSDEMNFVLGGLDKSRDADMPVDPED